MAESSGFFADVSGDREYTSDWLAKYISSIVGNGTYDGELGVTADGSAMSVTLPSGRAWINGYYYCNDGNLTLAIDNADGVLNRKDIAVLRWDVNARSIAAQVIKGAQASTAVAPSITRTAEQYDLKLAEISVPAGTTAITQSMITDCRLDKSVCGIVTGAITQVDTTTFYNQIKADLADFKSTNEADFSAWLSSIKGKLSEDAAGNLQSEIDAHLADKDNPHSVTAEQVGATPSSHTGETISTEAGVHGIRWYDGKLQAKSGETWKDISTGSDGGAPANVSGLAATAGNKEVTIVWSDPADSVIEGVTVSKWAGSKLVRKEGAYPTDVTDGILLVDNKIRDTYKTTGYIDTGLTNGTTYYYAVFPYSDTGAVNKDEANRVSAVPRASVKYGVIWHHTQSSPVCERIDDSINYSATATNGATAGVSDFDGKPIYKDIKVCNVVNRAVVAYEGDAGFKRDGTNGDVMVEIPKFYYKVTDDGTNRTYEISNTALDGFNVAPRHAPCDDFPNGLNKIYVGAYEVSAAYKSISGAAPLVSETLPAFRTGFTGRGAGYHMMDWATQFEIQILYLVEFATWNSQLVVGNGNVSTTAAIATGGSDSVTGLTGCSDMSSSALAVKYRGMENLWGNILEWRDGINFDNSTIYICINPSKYASDTATNYTKLGYTKAASNGYISALGVDTSMPWAQISTGVDGSVSTYLCDYYWQNSGWRVADAGGSWSGGSDAGLFCLYSYHASSDSYADVGSRLLVLPEE